MYLYKLTKLNTAQNCLNYFIWLVSARKQNCIENHSYIRQLRLIGQKIIKEMGVEKLELSTNINNNTNHYLNQALK